MPSESLVTFLDQKLNDPSFLKIYGNSVTSQHISETRQELLAMPGMALRDLLNSEFVIALGSKRALNEMIGSDTSNGAVTPARYKDNKIGLPVLSVAVNKNDMGIGPTLRHEAGHAVDHINNDYLGFASRNPDFVNAVAQYQRAKVYEPRTEIAYEGDRGFRHEHAPLYTGEASVANELVAEMYNKYTSRLDQYNPQDAEAFMSRNYPHAWDEMKLSVMPQIGQSLKMQGLDAKARLLPGFNETPNIASLEWGSLSKGHIPGMEVNVDNWSNAQQSALLHELEAKEISAKIVPSSLQQGQLVVRVLNEDNIEKIQDLIEAKQFAPSLLRGQPWENVDTSTGNNALYLDVDTMTGSEQTAILNALQEIDIQATLKTSGIFVQNGRGAVISVEGEEELNKLSQIISGQNLDGPDPEKTPKYSAFEIIESKLGIENIRGIDFEENGDIKITVPETFSRSNFTALGIDDPGSLKRGVGSKPRTMTVEIPKDRVPKDLQISPRRPVLQTPNVQDTPKADLNDGNKGFFNRAIKGLNDLGKRSGLIAGKTADIVANGMNVAKADPIQAVKHSYTPAIRPEQKNVLKKGLLKNTFGKAHDIISPAHKPKAGPAGYNGAKDKINNLKL